MSLAEQRKSEPENREEYKKKIAEFHERTGGKHKVELAFNGLTSLMGIVAPIGLSIYGFTYLPTIWYAFSTGQDSIGLANTGLAVMNIAGARILWAAGHEASERNSKMLGF